MGILSVLLGRRKSPEPVTAEAVAAETPRRRFRITQFSVVEGTCICCQLCIGEVPDVLEWSDEDGIPRVREGGEALFQSHAEHIRRAYSCCPVDAIRITSQEI